MFHLRGTEAQCIWACIHTRTSTQNRCDSLPWRAKSSARNCLSLCDPLNDLSACLPVYLSVFIIIRICVCLTKFYLDLFVLLSPWVSSCLSLSCLLICVLSHCLLTSLSLLCRCRGGLMFLLLSFSVQLYVFLSLCSIGKCVHCCSDFCWAELELFYTEVGLEDMAFY